MGQPTLPQLADDIGRRFPQRGAAVRGQLEPSALDPGQSARLDQQRPCERRDRVIMIEVAMREMRAEGADGRGGGTVGLLTAPHLSRRAQFQYRAEVEQRLLLGQAYLVLLNATQRACVVHRVNHFHQWRYAS